MYSSVIEPLHFQNLSSVLIVILFLTNHCIRVYVLTPGIKPRILFLEGANHYSYSDYLVYDEGLYIEG